MRTVVALARCSHFPPTVAVTAFTTLLAVAAGAGPRSWWVAPAVLAGQLSVGWSNDWLDRGRDRLAGRTDKPLVRGDIADITLLRAMVAAVVACAGFSALLGWRAATAHLLAVALAWGYNAGLKSSVASALPYAGAFGLLPVVVTLSLQPPTLPLGWAVATGALLGAGAHFTNVLPDFATDAATGVRGLPHRLGEQGSLFAGVGLLAAGALVVALGPAGAPSPGQVIAVVVSLLLAVAVVAAGVTGRSRQAFPLTLLIAATVVVSFLAAGADFTTAR